MKINMLDLGHRFYKDLTNKRRYGFNEKYIPSSLLLEGEMVPYWLGFSVKGMHEFLGTIMDKNGIIMAKNRKGNGENDSHYYSPLYMAHYILACYNDYLETPDELLKEEIFKHLNKLEDSIAYRNDVLTWIVPTSIPRYGLGHHVSALVQGQVISAFIRGYTLFKKDRYIDIILKALELFSVPISKGGVKDESRWGVCYEEYPTLPPNYVVNGFISCLIDLKEVSLFCGSNHAESLYRDGISTFKNMIPYWILPYWSKYDLYEYSNSNARINVATRHYQYLHIDMLKALYVHSQDPYISKSISMLQSQVDNVGNICKMYMMKAKGILL